MYANNYHFSHVIFNLPKQNSFLIILPLKNHQISSMLSEPEHMKCKYFGKYFQSSLDTFNTDFC